MKSTLKIIVKLILIVVILMNLPVKQIYSKKVDSNVSSVS